MSQISTQHSVVPFVSGSSKAFNDQRLAKVGYKLTKAMKAKGETTLTPVCASIPRIDSVAVEVFSTELMPHLIELLERAQDGIFRSLYESSGGNRTSISDEELSIPACIGYLEAESTGSRISKESVEAFFNAAVRDNLTVVFSEKLELSIDDPAIQVHVQNHLAVMQMIAGKNVILTDVQKKAIRNVLKIADSEHPMFEKIEAKMDSFDAPVKEKILELIDF